MNGLRGVLAGVLTLVAIHTLVAYQGPNDRIAQLAGRNGVLVKFAQRFLDPTIPAIPERQQAATATAAPASTSGVYPSPSKLT